MLKVSDPAVSEISISLSITPEGWKSAKLIPKKSNGTILLNRNNQFDFLDKVEVGDIFEGKTRDGAVIEGIIIAKDSSTITLGNTVSIR